MMNFKRQVVCILLAVSMGNLARASVGFGDRNGAPQSPPTAPVSLTSAPNSSTSQSSVVLKNPEPPAVQDVEWLKIPYEKAENEVLALFQRDIVRLEESADSVAVFEVKTVGQLPPSYHKIFRAKLERVLLTSKKIKVKDCTGCEEARLIRTEKGEMRYESESTEPGRATKLSSQLGTDHLLYADLTSTSEDVRLRVRMIDGATGSLTWTKEYSTADIIKTREALTDSGSGDLGTSDSLARVIIGEIAFTTILSPGVSFMPSIDTGSGTSSALLPSFDLFIGEKFDRNRKAFGLQVGAMANLGSSPNQGKPLPWAMKLGPQFRYYFNPYSMTTARWALHFEIGAMISTGVTTPYVGLGPEMSMINRFSLSVMPIFILNADVSDTQILVQQADGSIPSSSPIKTGTFGGFGGVAKVNINW